MARKTLFVNVYVSRTIENCQTEKYECYAYFMSLQLVKQKGWPKCLLFTMVRFLLSTNQARDP